jgi:hypothetical protein
MRDSSAQEPRERPARHSLEQVATTFDAHATRPQLTPLEIDILLKEYAQNVTLATNAETHRSTVMSFIFAGIGAVIYALAALKFNPKFWGVALVVSALGAFGALLSTIYHERWMFYAMLARGYRWRIAAAVPALRLQEIRAAAKAAHREEFTRRIPLYAAWQWLSIGIAICGFAAAAVMLVAVIRGAK